MMKRVRTDIWAGLALAVVIVLGTAVALHFLQAGGSPSRGWRPLVLQGTTAHSLAVGHTHRGLLIVGTEQGVYRFSRGGISRRLLAARSIWSVALLRDDRTLLAGDQAGDVYRSGDLGRHWSRAHVTSQGVFAVAAVPTNANVLLAGGGGGIYRSVDRGLHWRRQLALADSGIDSFAWQPGASRVIFAGAVPGGVGGSAQVYVSRDAGLSWHVIGSHLSSGGVMSLAATPGGGLFAGTMGHAVWNLGPGLTIWNQQATGMPRTDDHVSGIVALPNKPNWMFAGTLGQGVYASNDGGAKWTQVSDGLSTARSATIVLSVTFSPGDDVLYAATADGVYELPSPTATP